MGGKGSSILVDPDEILAAWGFDQGQKLDVTRTSSLSAVSVISYFYAAADVTKLDAWTTENLLLVGVMPMVQALSLIDFTNDPVRPAENLAKFTDSEYPLLYRNARIYPWAYGLSSRTSKVDATVALLHMIVVLVQLVLGFTHRRQYRSPQCSSSLLHWSMCPLAGLAG